MLFCFISNDMGRSIGSLEIFVSVLVYLSLLLLFSPCHQTHFNYIFLASSSKRHTVSCFLALSASVQQDIFKPNWLREMGQVKSLQMKSYKMPFLLPTAEETRSLLPHKLNGLSLLMCVLPVSLWVVSFTSGVRLTLG